MATILCQKEQSLKTMLEKTSLLNSFACETALDLDQKMLEYAMRLMAETLGLRLYTPGYNGSHNPDQ